MHCMVFEQFSVHMGSGLPGKPLAQRIEHMERGRQKVRWACDNDMFECRLCAYGTHSRVERVKQNNDSRSRIRELILHFTLSIEGVSLDNDSSCPERTVEGDGVL